MVVNPYKLEGWSNTGLDLKMYMLLRATCLDVELLMEFASFNILDEGDILK